MLVLCTLVGCMAKQPLAGIEYVKVLSFGLPDSITAYNKGFGLGGYACYQPESNSILCRFPRTIDPGVYIIQADRVENRSYVDTFSRLIDALRSYPSHFTFDTTYTGDTYCGPELYVEYKDANGVHCNVFILGRDKVLNQFCHFFSRLSLDTTCKRTENAKRIDVDEEVVSALKRVGVYEQKESLYIPLQCEAGVNKEKIFGDWRSITLGKNHLTRYRRITFNRNGTWSSERVLDNDRSDKKSGTFSFTGHSRLIMKNDAFKTTYIVLKLSDNCFEIRPTDREYSSRYDRL